MKQLTVGSKIMEYVGEPLEVWVCHGDEGSEEKSNFISTNLEKSADIKLINLNDCFKFMKQSKLSISQPYYYGYVADYKNKTIYYDDYRVLKWLKSSRLPDHKIENHFKKFIQKDFSK